mgnify:CR=1 FL=1
MQKNFRSREEIWGEVEKYVSPKNEKISDTALLTLLVETNLDIRDLLQEKKED